MGGLWRVLRVNGKGGVGVEGKFNKQQTYLKTFSKNFEKKIHTYFFYLLSKDVDIDVFIQNYLRKPSISTDLEWQ